MKRMGMLTTRILTAAFIWSAAFSFSSKAEVPDAVRVGMEQPTFIPGPWAWVPQPLPKLESITEQPAPDRPVYGLYCWANEYMRYRDFIRDVGWKNFRLSGPINDAVFRAYIEDGAEVMFTMPAREPFADKDHRFGKWRNRGTFETDEAFIADYVEDVKAVVKRYGPNGTFFDENPDLPHKPLQFLEIYNEPNYWYLDVAREDKKNHWPPRDPVARRLQNEGRQELYGKLLKAGYTAVKELAPEIQVVGFAVGGGSAGGISFIEGVHRIYDGIENYYDIMSSHPYTRPAPPEALLVRSWGYSFMSRGHRMIRDVMIGHGVGDKPVWWTELNWSIYPEKGGRYDEKKRSGRDDNVTRELQAAYIVRGYLQAMRHDVKRLHYMSIVDTDGVNAGMLDRGTGDWRPSAHAVKHMIATMPNPKLTGAVQENEDGIYIYRFDPDFKTEGDNAVITAYRVQGPAVVTIQVDQPAVTVSDMLGDDFREIEVENGSLQIEIGPLPVYIDLR